MIASSIKLKRIMNYFHQKHKNYYFDLYLKRYQYSIFNLIHSGFKALISYSQKKK